MTWITSALHEHHNYDSIARFSSLNQICCTQNLKIKSKHHFIFNIPHENHAVYERENVEIYGTARKITDNNIIRLIRFACRVTMVSHNYSKFTAFLQQLWLSERASMLPYTYITSLVNPHTYLLSKMRVARGYCTKWLCRSLQMTCVHKQYLGVWDGLAKTVTPTRSSFTSVYLSPKPLQLL